MKILKATQFLLYARLCPFCRKADWCGLFGLLVRFAAVGTLWDTSTVWSTGPFGTRGVLNIGSTDVHALAKTPPKGVVRLSR
ncbi:MAG TPA: hypothetical protein VN957_27685 [Chthoniobacterales bacterium]|nr:hypothetical protein [Chthoniobacterales bacterium]